MSQHFDVGDLVHINAEMPPFMSHFTMAELPILFTGPMVRKILSGHKTQTRRVVTGRNSLVNGWRGTHIFNTLDFTKAFVDGGPSPAGNPGPYLKVPDNLNDCIHRIYPRVQRGDRLWVREAWKIIPGDYSIYYKADWEAITDDNPAVKWKPSIHMKKIYTRLWLEVADIRVERLRDISEEDAKAEGAGNRHDVHHANIQSCIDNPYRRNFAVLWDSINAKRGFGWSTNPWVYVIEFKKLEKKP